MEKDVATLPDKATIVELESINGSGSSKETKPESDRLLQKRIAFFEENFPSLFSDDWLSSPELLEFLEQEKNFIPPPPPTFDPDAEKKGLVPVTDRKRSSTEEHYVLGRIGNRFVRQIPKKKVLIKEADTSEL